MLGRGRADVAADASGQVQMAMSARGQSRDGTLSHDDFDLTQEPRGIHGGRACLGRSALALSLLILTVRQAVARRRLDETQGNAVAWGDHLRKLIGRGLVEERGPGCARA